MILNAWAGSHRALQKELLSRAFTAQSQCLAQTSSESIGRSSLASLSSRLAVTEEPRDQPTEVDLRPWACRVSLPVASLV